MSRSRRLRAWIGSLLLPPLVAGLVWWSFPDPAFELLDRTLGEKAYDRASLLDVICWQCSDVGENPHGLGSRACFEARHLALVRLVEMQDGDVPVPREECIGIESAFAKVESETPEGVVVVGTASLVPEIRDDRGDPYFRMHRFSFAPDGRLLQRTVCRH